MVRQLNRSLFIYGGGIALFRGTEENCSFPASIQGMGMAVEGENTAYIELARPFGLLGIYPLRHLYVASRHKKDMLTAGFS